MRVQISCMRDNRGNELFLRYGHAFVAQLVEDSPGSCAIVVDFCEMPSCCSYAMAMPLSHSWSKTAVADVG